MTDEISPDMLWYTCESCERAFTLADMTGEECPHCGHGLIGQYTDE